MPKEAARALLSQLPTIDAETGELTAVIETPRGSRNKYDYDDASGAFKLAGVLPEGTVFPYDFGFIPSTVGEDGDPLDVLIFLDEPAVVGCILTIRLIGVIEAEQHERDDVFRNDRLLAVATHAHTHDHVQSLEDLRPGLLDEIEAFFGHYNQLKGKQFKPLRRAGPDLAGKLVDKGQSDFQAKDQPRA
jgi:inorganic pyrophosphatase